ncbi:MAG: acylneuraminate cytidylyltransferase family protein [Syntrophomonadaceae bacterium]|nr:acylneuraminate cytidylyltransferase family protein [Syntrophomonadaceae bacterium]
MNVAFIPVRGGSKSIPLKNIKLIAGKPLVYWTIKSACECKYIDRVFISTDSERIRKTVDSFGFSKAETIERSSETATDTASTESAMLEFATKYDFENIVLIQATSPLLTAADLNGGFELFGQPGTDSVFSAFRNWQFLWKTNEENIAYPDQYDPAHRPRRQDHSGYLIENGAFYITKKELLIANSCRLSGTIRTYEMGRMASLEIDEPDDFTVIDMYLKYRQNQEDGD